MVFVRCSWAAENSEVQHAQRYAWVPQFVLEVQALRGMKNFKEGGSERANGRGREGKIREELSRLLSPTFFITALPLPPNLTLPAFWLVASTHLSMESLSSHPSFISPFFHGLHQVSEQRNGDTTAWTGIKLVYSTARSDSGRGDNGPRTNPFSSVTGREQPLPKAFLLCE